MKRIEALNKAIQDSINTVATAVKMPLYEPEYNAAFVLELPRRLNSIGEFKSIRFAGCFIHQSPIASFSGKIAKPARCEIGDLLVITRTTIDGDDRFNAAIIQWKVSTSFPCVLSSPGELKQLDLYEHWPIFSLSSKGGTFDIYPKTVTPGAQYGLILPDVQTVINCMIPSSNLDLVGSVSFARFIINMMKWHTGRPFDYNSNNSSDSWSRLINKLISASLSKKFTLKRISLGGHTGKFPRATPDFLSFLLDQETIAIFDDNTDNNAISILFIDMGPEPYEKRQAPRIDRQDRLRRKNKSQAWED